MPRTFKLTPFYIRTNQGECFYVDTLEDALYEFLSDDGYRLTLISEKQELVIRIDANWGNTLLPGETEVSATLTCRKKVIK